MLKDFTRELSPKLLNIEDKNRSNLFAWRGQFSPQLIQYLLDAYCLPGSVVLDPFDQTPRELCMGRRSASCGRLSRLA
jgi:hypothetical protein